MHTTSTKRLAAVWSREVNVSQRAGRNQVIGSIRDEMQDNFLTQDFRIHNILEQRSFRSIAGLIVAAVCSLLSGRPPSLQCLLFYDRAAFRFISKTLVADPPDVVYCDGVRTYYFLKHLRQILPQIRIVVDFDDLMSRRMQSLRTAEASLSLGYLRDKAPPWLRNALGLGAISKLIARYEEAALTRVENVIGRWADEVVLISEVEAALLAERYRALGCRARVHAIPPPVEVCAPCQTYGGVSRFIFIGTDVLPQNSLTIGYICKLWSHFRPQMEIHIFGNMSQSWPEVEGVIFHGYVATLQEVYLEGAVLFAPGILRGGLKTKVTEAFAYGCAVLGNDITFEGLGLLDYPLRINSEEELVELVRSPSSYLKQIHAAASLGQEHLSTYLSRKKFQDRWHNVFIVDPVLS